MGGVVTLHEVVKLRSCYSDDMLCIIIFSFQNENDRETWDKLTKVSCAVS